MTTVESKILTLINFWFPFPVKIVMEVVLFSLSIGRAILLMACSSQSGQVMAQAGYRVSIQIFRILLVLRP